MTTSPSLKITIGGLLAGGNRREHCAVRVVDRAHRARGAVGHEEVLAIGEITMCGGPLLEWVNVETFFEARSTLAIHGLPLAAMNAVLASGAIAHGGGGPR
jgi:hypothetical protein